ncbi:putative deoxyribonuclease TATDN2 [Tigriopus californicus]|uniref:putative deoxyribonuclease TATDN2 n=1 Tax=Tigriopus californicus TaxID=6832 RepID=UPI0027D9E39E|nr:putative deoxyribonuclease TATDN2 [Tigriopus californicus]
MKAASPCFVNPEPGFWFKHGLESSLELEPSVRVIYGCHPHFANEFDHYAKLTLENALKRPNVVGLGEIGLDYSGKNTCSRIIQQRAFRCQLEMGMKLRLPFCLHIRDADEDGMAVLEEAGMPNNYPFHLYCFTGSWKSCQVWLNKYSGCKIGLTPIITVASAYQVREVARQISLDRLLLETDAPYFLPNKVKFESDCPLTNSHPGFAIHTAAQVAALKKMSLKEVLKATRTNVAEIYRIEPMITRPQTRKATKPEPKYAKSSFFESSLTMRTFRFETVLSSDEEQVTASKRCSMTFSGKEPKLTKVSKARELERQSELPLRKKKRKSKDKTCEDSSKGKSSKSKVQHAVRPEFKKKKH